MHTKFAFELIKEAQEECERKNLKEIAFQLTRVCKKLVEESRKDGFSTYEAD